MSNKFYDTGWQAISSGSNQRFVRYRVKNAVCFISVLSYGGSTPAVTNNWTKICSLPDSILPPTNLCGVGRQGRTLEGVIDVQNKQLTAVANTTTDIFTMFFSYPLDV